MTRRDVVRAYYAAIDDGDDNRLSDLLEPDFVHYRPDRTLDGRERFIEFMATERPRTDTEHDLSEVCVGSADETGTATVFARGRLHTLDGDDLFGFVDVHRVGERIESLTTYTS